MATTLSKLWLNVAGVWTRRGVTPVNPTLTPVITDMTPRSGPVGTVITVSGFNFTSTTQVRFVGGVGGPGVNATYTIGSDTTLLVTVPAAAPDGSISVTNSAGTTTSSISFDVIPAPTITSFTPTTGAVLTNVTITGTNFTGATVVRFGAVNSATFTVNSATQITATVPASAVTGTITVITPGGTVASTGSFTVTGGSGSGGFTLVLDEQFTGGAINTSRWFVYNNSTFGAPTRIQTYLAANVIVGPGSAGATGGTSVKLLSKEIDAGSGTLPTAGNKGTRYSYTAGMMDTQSRGFYLPRYLDIAMRCKTPHGQGLWAAGLWMTCRNGGATMCEWDLHEYFHSQVPGKMSFTLHGTNNSGAFAINRYTNNVGGRCFFETPTPTPAWHEWRSVIRPVTDSSGNTFADPNAPSSFVKFETYLDGVLKFTFVDTSALYWTTNGGSADSFWQIYCQGSQIDGNNVGHPRSPLGYDHWNNRCVNGGTSPNACTVNQGGYLVNAPTWGDPGSTLEVDYFKAWKYTG